MKNQGLIITVLVLVAIVAFIYWYGKNKTSTTNGLVKSINKLSGSNAPLNTNLPATAGSSGALNTNAHSTQSLPPAGNGLAALVPTPGSVYTIPADITKFLTF